MPSFIRQQVDFDLRPDVSRLPRDDEVYVIKAFARHASHCATCAHPYEVHKQGGTLCAKGHQRALDVAQYLYNKGGRAFSLVDHASNQRIQVEIPAGCESVRGLLRAMERGLRLRRRTPSVSYDQTYYVAPRRTQPDRNSTYPKESRYPPKPRLETAEPPPYAYSRQHGRGLPLHYASRYGLFEDEWPARERPGRPGQQPIYYHAAPRSPPPVPPKDGRWH